MRSLVSAVLFAFVTVLTVSAEARGDGAPARTALSSSELMGSVRGFVDMSAFAPAPGSGTPLHQVTGRLTFGKRLGGQFRVLKNEPFDIPIDARIQSLPDFDFEFVQDGDSVIPARRGPIQSEHPNWEYVLEPGKAWTEAGDRGYTRASIPFALQERNANCLHNGVMSFLVREDGMISNVYYEIASETCAYLKFDAWGQVAASFVADTPAGSEQIVARFRLEIASRLPVRPIRELTAQHPGVSETGLALAKSKDADPATLFGVVVDGIHYVSGCETRRGSYPFCDVLDLPSYSTAKTLVGAIGLMRLEKLSPGARSALISDYVPECSTRDWSGVSFENALDMTTGLYDQPGYEADENSKDMAAFFLAETHAQRVAFACKHYVRKSSPGERWVYHTTDTYVLGTAMAAYSRKHLQQQDFYDELLVRPLWNALQLSPPLDFTRRSRDDIRQPFTGYGLTYHRDDIARLARFLAADDGAIGGEAKLDETMLKQALQRDPDHRGLTTGDENYRYKGAVWARNVAPIIGCPHEVWVPYMAGYGGNLVVMLPNGIQYYYFSDSWAWDWGPAAEEINRLSPLCKP